MGCPGDVHGRGPGARGDEPPAPGCGCGVEVSVGTRSAWCRPVWAVAQNAASSSSMTDRSVASATLRSAATPGSTVAQKNLAAAILPW